MTSDSDSDENSRCLAKYVLLPATITIIDNSSIPRDGSVGRRGSLSLGIVDQKVDHPP